MSPERENFFDGYDPADLAQQETLNLSHRELLLVRMGLAVLLRESSRKDHIYNDLHMLLQKLPPVIERRAAPVSDPAPDRWLRRTS